ncbi:T9SS type A sorting domain-containing protein [Flavobacterium sp. SE-s28]|uniref:T9SS type A sorting domain-containing protein n=2 Tax=Flavobacterium silvaticum TaxID=1852020 RepID=A0A972FM48_9FLAO|nr:T9SS type A sorting domain-containing protein [Flavobacterium silvaticum]
MRHWGSFRDAAGALAADQQLPEFQPSEYNANTTGWQFVTVTGVAPATATLLRVDFRVFRESADAQGGTVYVDNASVEGQLSVKQNAIAGLKIYPNPVSGNNLNISTTANSTKNVVIFDVLGKQVISTKIEGETVNVSALKSGVYIVKVTEEGKTATRKLVVK